MKPLNKQPVKLPLKYEYVAYEKEQDPYSLEPSLKQVDLVARTMMIEDGLVPTYLLAKITYEKLVDYIDSMPTQKQREHKRKFRKVYRLAEKEYPLGEGFFSYGLSPGRRKQNHVTYWYRMRARKWLKGKDKEMGRVLDVEDLLIKTRCTR